MMQYEFEALALRGDAHIGPMMYDSIERFYMSDNNYHQQFGGRDENKRDFVKRVFGGKVNTPKSIARKIIAESIKENRWCLQGHDKKRLDEMDVLITDHYDAIYRHNW